MKNLIAHSKGCTQTQEQLNKEFKTVTITYCPECSKSTRTEIVCEHDYEPLRLELETGSIQVRMYCKKCHSITPKSEPHSKFDLSKLRKSTFEKYRTFFDELCEAERHRILEFTEVLNYEADQFNRKDYNEYLNSDWWKHIRSEALERDNETCQMCGNPAEEVHHMTYVNRGNEYLFELVSLCKNCHVEYHVKLDKV
jgi:hypothetical protein